MIGIKKEVSEPRVVTRASEKITAWSPARNHAEARQKAANAFPQRPERAYMFMTARFELVGSSTPKGVSKRG